MILYEYPLNERVRTLLRLEDLFERFGHFSDSDDPKHHHVALVTLFDILDVAARTDLKTDLMLELERQRQALLRYRDNPAVSPDALESILVRIEAGWKGLNDMTGKTGQHLRDNEWLMSIRSRTIIAGGACEFDLPSYWAWQNRPAIERRRDIMGWIAPFEPIGDSMNVVLKLLRESAQWSSLRAEHGSIQQTLGGKAYQLVQLRVEAALGAIPEISANKYLLWIRFTAQDGSMRPRPFEEPVDFRLALCNL